MISVEPNFFSFLEKKIPFLPQRYPPDEMGRPFRGKGFLRERFTVGFFEGDFSFTVVFFSSSVPFFALVPRG